jgi:hypothetical protein
MSGASAESSYDPSVPADKQIVQVRRYAAYQRLGETCR